eukprot:546998-Rhodomonas_salina.1
MTLQNNYPHPEEVYDVAMQAISDQLFDSRCNVLIQVPTAFEIELPVQHFDFLLIAQDQIKLLVQHCDFLL